MLRIFFIIRLYTRLSLKPSPKLINFRLKKIAICAFESLGHLKKILEEIINLLNMKLILINLL